jgi:catechol 2,3-dioxygenase-like lactoylglutathione lyase family enzyme
VALSFSQRVKYQETVCQGGKSKGNGRHAQPVRTTGGGGSGAGEAVAVGAGLDDVAAEGLVGGDRDGVLLLAFGEDLEQQFGAAAVEAMYARDMTIQRMDHVGVVVDDLAAAIAIFVELGMELEGEAPVEGRWVDRVVGLDDVRVDIAMMRTPDGHGRLELTKFHTPTAVSAEPENAPANTLGIRRIMFAVEDIEDVLARLHTHGAELVGELAQYEDSYRLCYVRGPEGIIVALAEQLS